MSRNFRKTVRLPFFDYGASRAYFVTMRTHNGQCLFGTVKEGRIEPSAIGSIVEEDWHMIPSHLSYVSLDAFIIMPNHVHGILLITDRGRGEDTASADDVEDTASADDVEDTASCVTTRGFGKVIAGTLPVVMRSFKAGVTKRVHEVLGKNIRIWQPNYYEHVIRGERELQQIRDYIANNPSRWDWDEENLHRRKEHP